ncbi:bile acid:sodium symporter family protein [Proteiniphilum sp. X52]|uniref:bile acid:sodium symporter family protein n=1 Tax=Proteiniphilum sp. X52 TaxID=2382159 RepID=UPI000F0A7EC3|nr:transporter [Proteiniphilum sp. X52]RNC64566.1 transporter [Proteiniphilum sp. X52]
MRKYIEKYLLPIAMALGIAFHTRLSVLSPFIPYLLAMMLFITYSRVRWSDIRPTKFHYILLSIQYVGSALIYLALRPFNETLAQAAMICMLTATATSAPVVAGMLGGSIAMTAAYAIISNLTVALIAPLFLSLVGKSSESIPLAASFWHIFRSVMPILVIPFLAALLLRKSAPRIHKKIQSAQIVSFYLWAVALTIVIGNITYYVRMQGDDHYRLEIMIGVVSLIICLLQFYLGRKIGRRFGQTVAGGQGLGQKNTVLAIWLTQTYLNPLATLGPGMYVLWQNLVNSWQIWREKRRN